MKRKRGHKGGYKKGSKKNKSSSSKFAFAPHNDDDNAEDGTSMDRVDDNQLNRQPEIEECSVGSEKAGSMSNSNLGLPNEKSTTKAGPGRIKVKLKSSRVLEPHKKFTNLNTKIDIERRNTQEDVQLVNMPNQKEDNTCSDVQSSAIAKSSKKGIKFKSSMSSTFSNAAKLTKNACEMNNPQTVPVNENISDSSTPKHLHRREMKELYSNPRYNEKELSASLDVIKKVMKMDAASPFNAPVNPIALGIPDYFEIIDTPMDFGTICNDLEHRRKYMNSEDVYRDVQYIWENCYKYNNKGDYIVDLMKRVKKNFVKYWAASHLYVECDPNKNNSEVAVQSSDKHPKNKSKHKRRRYGIEHHKSDCLCAVCVVRRRRKEREGDKYIDVGQSPSEANISGGCRIEGQSPVENPGSENVSSSLDRSREMVTNADTEEAEYEEIMEILPDNKSVDREQDKQEELVFDDEFEVEDPHENPPRGNEQSSFHMAEPESRSQSSENQFQDLITEGGAPPHQEENGVSEGEDAVTHHNDQDNNRYEMVNKAKQEDEETKWSHLEGNRTMMQICKVLFPAAVDSKSVWNGPHSFLVNRRLSPSSVVQGANDLRAAVQSLLLHN